MVSRNKALMEKIEEEKRNLVLGVIGEGKTFNEIAEALEGRVSRSTVARHLKELEKSGNVRRVAIPGERRIEYRLTEKAKKSGYFKEKTLALMFYSLVRQQIKAVGSENFLENLSGFIGVGVMGIMLATRATGEDPAMRVAMRTYLNLIYNDLATLFDTRPELLKTLKKELESYSAQEVDLDRLIQSIAESEKEAQALRELLFST